MTPVALAIIAISTILSLLAGSAFAAITMLKERGLAEIVIGSLVTMTTVGGSTLALLWSSLLS
ncbi:hypothetical protein GCM10023333_41860 [Ferrimonas pelagia]|uniref:ZIP family metal transporter n=1 Tax=Ferrimonas pelagia TaxID=1177826 RepID=A0ABP9FIZ1_9GAMM